MIRLKKEIYMLYITIASATLSFVCYQNYTINMFKHVLQINHSKYIYLSIQPFEGILLFYVHTVDVVHL